MKNIESKIKEFNREILRLKTQHPVKSNMKTFYGKYQFYPDTDNKTHEYEITYVEGSQPILTTLIGVEFTGATRTIIFTEPVGNKQIMLDMVAHHDQDLNFYLLSTRQILGVRRIS